MVPRRTDDPGFAFLVSTAGGAGDLPKSMGQAAYSYGFVLRALAPVFESLGTWRRLPAPESSLAFAAERATRQEYRPVHLALQPPQALYQTPAVPTVLFPFWEFPDVPDRNFGLDARQDWRRICRPVDLIVTACQFTADAFRRAGISCPIEVVPVPIDPGAFEMPPWEPSGSWSTECRHFVWGGDAPHLSFGPPPPPPRGLRGLYHGKVRPWLSPLAVERLRGAKRTILRRPPEPLPLLPKTPLTLSGLVYTSIFNYSDNRKNPGDMLTAFLSAFRDRDDVTLVIKMATSPTREFYELQELRGQYARMGIRHRCKVVVITDFLSDEQMSDLLRVSTYYLNTSHAEGACLPIQQAMASARPAVAPGHTSMADYLDDSVGFVIESHPEPAFWPHDPERRFESSWHRLVWSDLRDRLRESATLVRDDLDRYHALGEAARRRMSGHATRPIAREALARALARLPERPAGAHSWVA